MPCQNKGADCFMSIKEELIPKIQNKTLTMGVCGLG